MTVPVSRLLSLVVLGVGIGSASGGAEVESPAVTAARKRQQAVQTLAVEFKVVHFVAKGAIAKALTPPLSGPYPARDTTLESENRLVLDGDRIRYEDNHVSIFKPGRDAVPLKKLSVYDGSSMTTLYPPVSAEGSSNGVVHGAAPDFTSPILDPIGHAFRPLDPQLCSQPIDALNPTGARLAIGGELCEEFACERPGAAPIGPVTYVCYLAPDNDHAVRRIIWKRAGQLHRQQDIAYKRADGNGWLPTAWHIAEYSPDGEIRSTTKVDVVRTKINGLVSPDEFKIVFPEATQVVDQATNKMYQVRPDGSLAEFDTGASNTWSEPPLPQGALRKWLLIGGAIVLFAGFIGAYFLRRRKGVAR
jgi:hypothetical protein